MSTFTVKHQLVTQHPINLLVYFSTKRIWKFFNSNNLFASYVFNKDC